MLATVGCASLQPWDVATEALKTGTFLDIEGQKVHVWTRGDGDAVLLLHGFGASSWSWRIVGPELARNHRVIALDLNGFGLTERTSDFTDYTREGQVELAVAVLDRLGVDSAHVIGHSYGGAVAITLAALHPERVDRLVLVDSAPPEYPLDRRKRIAAPTPVTWAFVRLYALRRANVRRALERAFADDSLVDDELVDGYFERLRIEGAARAYWRLTAPRQGRGEPPEAVSLGDVQAPTLVLWGEEDRVVDLENGRWATTQFPDARFVVIERAGHNPMEEQPQAWLDQVRGFLDGGMASDPEATSND